MRILSKMRNFFSIFLGIGLSGMNFANYPTSQFMVFLTQYMFELDIKKSAENRTHSKFKLWLSQCQILLCIPLLAYQSYFVLPWWPIFCVSEGMNSKLIVNLN